MSKYEAFKCLLEMGFSKFVALTLARKADCHKYVQMFIFRYAGKQYLTDAEGKLATVWSVKTGEYLRLVTFDEIAGGAV